MHRRNRKLIGAYLSRCGLTFSMVENGKEAVELALGGDFDLILMDVRMPVLGGVEATGMLRAASYAGPIVALTANVMPEDVAGYLDSGYDDCVAKPIDFKLLARCLEKWLTVPAVDVSWEATDLAGFAPIRRAFEDALAPRLDALCAALQEFTLELALEQAHVIKGSAGSFGYPEVSVLAAQLEDAVRVGDAALALVQLAKINELPQVQELRVRKLGT